MRPLISLLVGVLLVGTQTAAAAPGDRPGEKLPADCFAVFHLDLAALRKTKAYDWIAVPLATDLVEGSGIEDLKKQLALEPKEMTSLTFGLYAQNADEGPPLDVVIRGKFDTERIVKAATASDGYEVEQKGTVTTFRPTSDYSSIHVALVGDQLLLLAGTPERMKKLLAAAQAKPTERAIVTLLARNPAAQYRVACVPNKVMAEACKEHPEIAALLAVQSILFTAVITDEKLEQSFVALAKSEKDAKQVTATLRSLLAAMPMGDTFEKSEIRQSGVTVTVHASVALAEIAKENGLDLRNAPTVLASKGAPDLKGAGRLDRVLILGRSEQINEFHTSSNERHILANVARSGYFVLNSQFSIAGRSRDLPGTELTMLPDGKTALWINFGSGDVDWDDSTRKDMGHYAFPYSLPDLKRLPASPKLGYGKISNISAIRLLPDKKTYAIVSWSGVQILRTDPLQWGAHGQPKIEQTSAAAVDLKTGLLVVTGDENRVEIFDPKTMRSVWTATLPYNVSFSVEAAGGTAWVGTEAGVVLPIDLKTHVIGKPLRLVEKGDTAIALSASGKTLAVVATTWVDPQHHPTLLKIYRVENGTLTETVSARFVARRTPTSPVLIETKSVLLLAGAVPLAWHYGDK